MKKIKKKKRGRLAPKRRRGRKYGKARSRAPKYRKIECQLGQAALRYARAKGFLSRIEKGMAKSENPDPHKRQKIAKKIADVIRAAAKEDLAGRPVSNEELKRRIRAVQKNPRRCK